MLNPDLYIYSAGLIAPEAAPGEAVLRLDAREPDYTGFIPPMQLRRMSKAVRMGIGAAKACLEAAGAERPDAIAVGTTLGCVQDTEVFLGKLVAQDERMLTPTAFIQSTHNTVAGQIALVTGCHGYNTTISQRGHSFEGAVMSASLYLSEHPGHMVLCGGVDEQSKTSLALLQRTGVYTLEPFAPESLLQRQGSGAIAGEGAAFLLLGRVHSASGSGPQAKITGLQLMADRDASVALEEIRAGLELAGASPESDALWLGASGDAYRDDVYRQLQAFWKGPCHLFKARTGEWGTSISAAICLALREWPGGMKRSWIVNHYGRDWSLWLLGK